MSITTTKYATPEQATRCAEAAKAASAKHERISDDTAREYVTTHRELCKKIVQASVLMYKARYDKNIGEELGEEWPGHAPHLVRASDTWGKATDVCDEITKMLDYAEDLDDNTRDWLKYDYLYDLLSW